MSALWHCCLHHQTYGPLTEEQLREMAEQGQLAPQTLLRPVQAGAAWAPLAQQPLPAVLSALATPSLASSSPACSSPSPQADVPAPVPVEVAAATETAAPGKRARWTKPTGEAAGAGAADASPAAGQAAAPVVPVQSAAEDVVPVTSTAPVPVTAASTASVVAVVPVETGAAATVPVGAAVVPASTGSSPATTFVRRKKNPLPLVIGLSIAAVAALITLVIALNSGPKPPADTTTTALSNQPVPAAAVNPASSDPAATDPAATDPAATDPAATDPAATDPVAGAPSTPAKSAASARRLPTRWSPLGATKMLGNVAMIKLESVWLEDEGKRLVAKVSLRYLSEAPINYSSWQGSGQLGAEAAAQVLLEQTDAQAERVHRAIPSADKPPAQLIKNASVIELLSFPAPQEGDEVVKLMLPAEAIGRTMPPFGFEISRAARIAGVNPDTAPPPAAADPSAVAGVPETAPVAVVPAAPTPAPKPDDDGEEKIPSIADINRQIGELQEREAKEKMEAEKNK